MASTTKKTSSDTIPASINLSSSISDDLLRISTSEEEADIPIYQIKANPQLIIAHNIEKKGGIKYLIKFRNKSYYELEWLKQKDLLNLLANNSLIRNYEKHQDLEKSTKPPYFNNEYLIPEKIITDQVSQGEIKYLVKWTGLDYCECTWESSEFIKHHHEYVSYDPHFEYEDNNVNLDTKFEKILKDYEKNSVKPSEKDLMIPTHPNPFSFIPIKQSSFPRSKSGLTIRYYQVDGVNFMMKQWFHHKNAILADEMGLGKTLQSLMFLNLLYIRQKVWGPFLIIAPLSTMANWEREANEWTDLRHLSFYGSKTRRTLMLQNELFYVDTKIPKFQILFTTYEYAVKMADTFSKVQWEVIVIDEAHRIKNIKSKLFSSLLKIPTKFKLLLTGTPLQNNISELWSLLNFLNDREFNNSQEFTEKYGNLSEAEQIVDLQNILKPLMLRRLKGDVEKSISPFEEIIIECPMSQHQKAYYTSIYQQNMQYLTRGAHTQNHVNMRNVCMELRKCCNHPYLINGAEKQILVELREAENLKSLDQSNTHSQNSKKFDEEKFDCDCLIRTSGKMILLDKLLLKMKKDGHRVLIFSQMNKMLDIIQDYLLYKGYKFQRIDGSIKGEERQSAIDKFNDPMSKDFIFLLSTKSGGVGINLTSADTVIIYDSDWNPQNDIQATARCHRIGQTKDVKVYRFVTANSYERTLFDCASHKLGLDSAVLGGSSGLSPKKQSEQIEKMLKLGAYYTFAEDGKTDDEEQKINEEDIDSILKRSQRIKHDHIASGVEGSTFSKLQFEIEPDSGLDLTAPNFWQKYIPKETEETQLIKRRVLNKSKEKTGKSKVDSDSSSDSDEQNNENSNSDFGDKNDYSNSSNNEDDDDEFTSMVTKQKKKKLISLRYESPISSSDDENEPEWTEKELSSILKLLVSFGIGRWSLLYDHCEEIKNNHTKYGLKVVSLSILRYLIDNTPNFSPKDKVVLEDAYFKPMKNEKRDMIDMFIKTHLKELDSITKVDKSYPFSKILYIFYLNAVVSSCKEPPFDIPIPNPVSGPKPKDWWTEKDDKILLFHVWKKGINDFSRIRLTHDFDGNVLPKGKKFHKEEEDDVEMDDSIRYFLSNRVISILIDIKCLFSVYRQRVAHGNEIHYDSKVLQKAIDLWTVKEQRNIINALCNHGINKVSKIYFASDVNRPFKKFKQFVYKLIAMCNNICHNEENMPISFSRGALAEEISKSLAEKVLTRITMIDKLSKLDDLSKFPDDAQAIIKYVKENGFDDLHSCPEIIQKFKCDKVGLKVSQFIQEILGMNQGQIPRADLQSILKHLKEEKTLSKEFDTQRKKRKPVNKDEILVPMNLKRNSEEREQKPKRIITRRTKFTPLNESDNNDIEITSVQTSTKSAKNNALLPLTIHNNLVIVSLGEIVRDRPGFRNDKYLYPSGFVSEHLFTSATNPAEKVWYRSRIIDDGGPNPVFRVEMKDDPSVFFEGKNPTNPWMKLVKEIERVKQKLKIGVHSLTSISGPVYFGFAVPEVKKMIKALPGASENSFEAAAPVVKTEATLPKTRKRQQTKSFDEVTAENENESGDEAKQRERNTSSSQPYSSPMTNESDQKAAKAVDFISIRKSQPAKITRKRVTPVQNSHDETQQQKQIQFLKFKFDKLDFNFPLSQQNSPFALNTRVVNALLRKRFAIPANQDPVKVAKSQGWIF